MKFKDLALPQSLIENLEENNFIECTEVQKESIPNILEEKSLMVQAQTGTGKTAAFLIPLIAKLIENKEGRGNRGLVIAPTRELAAQIMEDAQILGCEEMHIKGAVLSGGSSIVRQERDLRTSRIIVATPGRLLDFCNKNNKLLSQIEYFVMDECDRLFDMGFYPDIKKIIGFLPPAEKRLSLLFSATLDRKVRNLASRDFHDAIEIDVSSSDLAVDMIVQEKALVAESDKVQLTLGLLARLEGSQSVVVFTNTKHSAEKLALKLMYNKVSCDYITGDLPQNKRQRVIQNFKEGKVSVLVATDVAARGLHVHNLDLVINFDVPDDAESYIHRIGRTGRAGEKGEAVTFVCEKYARNLEGVEKLLRHKIPQMEVHYVDLLVDDESKGLSVQDIAKEIKVVLRSHKSFRDRDSKHTRNSSSRNSSQGGRGREGGRSNRSTTNTRSRSEQNVSSRNKREDGGSSTRKKSSNFDYKEGKSSYKKKYDFSETYGEEGSQDTHSVSERRTPNKKKNTSSRNKTTYPAKNGITNQRGSKTFSKGKDSNTATARTSESKRTSKEFDKKESLDLITHKAFKKAEQQAVTQNEQETKKKGLPSILGGLFGKKRKSKNTLQSASTDNYKASQEGAQKNFTNKDVARDLDNVEEYKKKPRNKGRKEGNYSINSHNNTGRSPQKSDNRKTENTSYGASNSNYKKKPSSKSSSARSSMTSSRANTPPGTQRKVGKTLPVRIKKAPNKD